METAQGIQRSENGGLAGMGLECRQQLEESPDVVGGLAMDDAAPPTTMNSTPAATSRRIISGRSPCLGWDTAES